MGSGWLSHSTSLGCGCHVGGGYWQRASFDAVVVLASLLGLLAFAPPLRLSGVRGMSPPILTLGAAILFYLMLAESFRFAARMQPRFERLEQNAPS